MFSHIARCDAAHNLGKRQAAALAALPHAAQQRPQELALIRQPLLIPLCLQAPTEATLSRTGAGPSAHGKRMSQVKTAPATKVA